MQPKDTAYSLARRFGLSVDVLLNLNKLQSPNLAVGQVLLVSPPTYTVVRGDTAFSVARRFGLSVDALLSLNHLGSANLSVGQVLNLGTAGSAPGPVPAATITSSSAPTTINLTAINSAPLTEPILASPTISSATISTITVTPEASSAAATLPDPLIPLGSEVTPGAADQATILPGDPQDWLANAQSLLGVPYVWGGKSRKGTDCSGFVLQVFTPLGVSLPRSSAQQAQIGLPVERAQLQSGDLVFFDTEGRGRVTHVGIALSATTFINANSYVGKVAVDDLSSRYWATRYLGARRILGVMASR